MSEPSVIHSDPEIMSGTPVFRGTRVPVRNLLDYLEGGYPIDDFLDDFPSVTREQVIAHLRRLDPLPEAELSADLEAFPLTPEQRDELGRRLDDFAANPESGVPWSEVRDNLLRGE